MRTTFSHKATCPLSNYQTSSSIYPMDKYLSSSLSKQVQYQSLKSVQKANSAYLSGMNFHLLRQISQTQQQKNYYKQRLSRQYHTHHSQLQQAFRTLSQKNSYIIQLQQQIDRLKKDYRVVNDDYVILKNSYNQQKDKHKKQMEKIKQYYQDKIIKIQQEQTIKIQKMVNKRVKQVQQQCDLRVQMLKKHIQQSKQYSNQLNHQLKLLQQDYKQVLLKNQTIIQQSIHRQLRKRDFQAQNNYLRDVSQYQHLKKINQQLKQQLSKQSEQISKYIDENKQLKAKHQILLTKMKDIEEAFQYEKKNNKVSLEAKYKQTDEIQTNTEQNYVPLIFPVDTNLVGEIVSLRDFLVQKLICQYQQFFVKAALKQHKKAASLITFKNYLNQIKSSKQNSILLYIQSGIDRIVKLYCPAMNYSREYLTVKDEFIRKTLMECQTIKDNQQKLFRLLQLVHRLHQPILNIKSEISTGELKLVQIKVLATLKKILCEK